MRICLLDTNILLAMAWPTHPQHDIAHQWFAALSPGDFWATCPLTQCGFVRLSSNPKFTPDALTVPGAIVLLRHIITSQAHVFWADDVDMMHSSHFPHAALRGHRQVTDAYLLALSVFHGGKLATLDGGIESLVTPKNRDALVVVR